MDETLTPIAVDRALGMPELIIHGYHAAHYSRAEMDDQLKGFYKAYEAEDASAFANERLREIAEAGWEESLGRYPDNAFRRTTPIMRDGCGDNTSFLFEVILTPEGEKARANAKLSLCVDAKTGELHKDATLKYWFWRIRQSGVLPSVQSPQSSPASWVEEDWAKPIRDGIALAQKGIRITREGEASYPETVSFWCNHLNLLEYKNHFLSMEEEWAKPIQDEIVLRIMKQPVQPTNG